MPRLPLDKLLNPQQLAAATHPNGPLLILAGAGSGKTRVLTHRIAHLLETGAARASEVLAVTFTNKAAGELKERVAALVGPEADRLWVATFHAAGARILRREAEALGLTRSFAIYDDADQLAAMKRVCADLGIDANLAKPQLSRIDRWKNEGVLPEDVRLADHDVPGKTALKAYARYQAALQASNALDFGDLIARVIELFKKRPDLSASYAGRFRQILVDEFQDTNPAQYQLLRMLSATHGNLCVVGDDDQSIYRWRGAEVDNILDFPKHFAGTTVVKLEQNYRSTGNILAAAHKVIARNERRAEKKLWTAAGPGERLRVWVADDERDEGQRIAQELYAEHARGTAYAQMAVFYRANAQSRALEDQLRARKVPYRIVRGRSFYDRAEVKDVAAYLRLSVNPRSDGDLLRIINTPPRGIGDTTVERLRASASRAGRSLWESLLRMEEDPELPQAARSKLAPFRKLISELQAGTQADGSAQRAIAQVLALTGYEDRLRLEGEEGEDRIENLRELLGAAREFDQAFEAARKGQPLTPAAPQQGLPPGALGSGTEAESDDEAGDRPDLAAAVAAAAPGAEDEGAPETALLGFLEQLALVGDADAADGGDRASLMTLHAAKGLEFDAVWMTGLEERVFPHGRALGMQGPGGSGEEDPAELAEERRLCYVGMTRARKRLSLSFARCRTLFGELRFNPPSRFLRELDAEVAEGLSVLTRDTGMARGSSKSFGSDDNLAGSWRSGGGAGRGQRDEYDFDQRPHGFGDDAPSTPSRRDPGIPAAGLGRGPARPKPTSAGPAGALGPGSRVRHPTFGVGTVEDAEGSGPALKLLVRFGPGVGLKKVLARFLEPA